MKQKPGVMIYFDMLPVMQYLSDAEVGCLFRAILKYAKSGTHEPMNERLELLWPLIRQRVDADYAHYDMTVIQRKYAAYVRWEKRNGRDPMGYPQWVDTHGYESYDEVLNNALASI